MRNLIEALQKVDFDRPIVFISYASEELELADFVRNILKKCSSGRIDPFVARRDIAAGEDPLKVMLESNLKCARGIIPICSIRSKLSSWVWWESSAVWARNQKVYPLFTNISPNDFGAPINLVCQGKEYFNTEEFIETIRMICKDLDVRLNFYEFEAEDLKIFLELKKKYSTIYKDNGSQSQMACRFLSLLNLELKEVYTTLFVGPNPYYYGDCRYVLLNYKAISSINKNTIWPDLIKLDVFHDHLDFFQKINLLFSKFDELNLHINRIKSEVDMLHSGSIDVRHYRSIMSDIKDLYGARGDNAAYSESSLGIFLDNQIKNLN